jgi:hypothetical protein
MDERCRLPKFREMLFISEVMRIISNFVPQKQE